MLKPRLAVCVVCTVGLLLVARRASAQYNGGPGGVANTEGNALSTIMNHPGGGGSSSGKGKQEHDLKSAEAGLGDADPRVRVEALRQLRNVTDTKADFLLIRAMSDPDTRVRVKAIDILGGRGNPDAVTGMCQ